MQRVVPIVIVVLLVAFVAGGVFFDLPARFGLAPAPGPRPELQVLVQKHMEPLLENPLFRERVRGLGAAEAQRLGMAMSAAGLARLDGPSLVTRASLMAAALEGSGTRVCAGIARGNATPTDIEGALLTLGPERLERWAEVSAEAMLAELEERPAPAIAPEDARNAITALADLLPGDDGERLTAIMRRLQSADDRDLCWMGRTLYRGVERLPQAQGELLARALVSR